MAEISLSFRLDQLLVQREGDLADVGFGQELLHTLVADCDLNARLDAQAVQHVEHRRQLLLRQQVDLKVQVRPTVRKPSHVVLRHHHHAGEEDGLERDDQVQQVEGGRIEGETREVQPDPGRKPDRMERDEGRASGDPRNGVGQPIDGRPVVLRLSFQFGDCLDVVNDRMFMTRPWSSRCQCCARSKTTVRACRFAVAVLLASVHDRDWASPCPS
jgi:hypothetical protein